MKATWLSEESSQKLNLNQNRKSMKKISKLKFNQHKEFLIRKEMIQLKGGYSGDVNNNNKVMGCGCDYNNNSLVSNNNEVSGCKCTCN